MFANAVVRRQPLVEERIVGRQQLHDAAVVAHLAADEQPRLLLHRVAQVLVEFRIQLGVGDDAGELAQLEPAAGEIVDQRVRARIAEHPLHLLFERAGSLSVPRTAASRSSSSGMLLQRKNDSRDARSRSLEAIGRARRDARGLAFDAEEEARRREDALEPALDAGIEAAASARPAW